MEKLTILISGASGFVGSALSKSLSSSHRVIALPRDFTEIPEADVIISLSGAPINQRWTAKAREEILSSRVDVTKRLVHQISKLKIPPTTFISASAVGYYGDRGEESLDESSPPGSGFLSSVCVDWELASLPLEDLGIRRVLTRFGVVIGSGGMVQKLLPLVKLHLAGRAGSGDQWMSWIGLKDLVRAIAYIVEHPTLHGPVNCVSLNPVRQKEFAEILAHSSWQMPQPASLIRLFLGDMGRELLLSSTRVQPKKLQATGFSFQTPTLHKALSGLT